MHIISKGLLLIPLVAALFSGCVGVRTYQVSDPSGEISTEELDQALIGRSASVTFVDGTMYEGRITQVRDDSLTMRVEEPRDALTARREEVYAISTSGCPECRVAGAVCGGIIGLTVALAAGHPSGGSSGSFNIDLSPVAYGLAGSLLGGTLVGFITPPEMFLFRKAPELLDTLRVEQEEVISNTRGQITVRQAQKSITYDKRLVRAVNLRDHVLLIRPSRKETER